MKSANFSTNLPPKILQNFAFYSPEISEALLSILHIGKIAQTWFLAWLFGFTSFHFPDFGLNLLNGFDLWWSVTLVKANSSVWWCLWLLLTEYFVCMFIFCIHLMPPARSLQAPIPDSPRLRAVSYFSLQSYYMQNLSTRAGKLLARETRA